MHHGTTTHLGKLVYLGKLHLRLYGPEAKNCAPFEEAREILRAEARAGRNLRETAEELGVSYPRLVVLVSQLGMNAELRVLRYKAVRERRARYRLPRRSRGIVVRREETEVASEKASQFQAMMTLDPDRAKMKLIAAFTKARCLRMEAGAILGVNNQTFSRWARKLGVQLDKLEERARKEGWFHENYTKSPGRPQKDV